MNLINHCCSSSFRDHCVLLQVVALALILRAFDVAVSDADAAAVVPEETIAYAPTNLFVNVTPRC